MIHRLRRLCVLYLAALLALPDFRGAPTDAVETQRPDVHPLMPGIRSTELHNPDWPRTYHDKLVTGFSPLNCDMQAAPEMWSTFDVAKTVDWVHTVRDSAGREMLLVFDGTLRMASPAGNVLWTNRQAKAASSAAAAVLYFGDLHGNGSSSLLLADGRRLSLLDGTTGEEQWSHLFEPAYVSLQSRPTSLAVADIRPDLPGLEAAIFPMYSERAYLIQFPPGDAPRILWDVSAIVPDEHAPGPGGGERADHGCWTEIDLSIPEQPVIWNVRHHRCRGFDPWTGEMVSSLVYEIGGSQKRNYGPAKLGYGTDGKRLMCVAGEAVQFHVHAIALERNAPSRLLWQDYYGELLVANKPGRRALHAVAIDDIDADGRTEFVYNLTDETRDLRSFTIIRDAETGDVEAELADCNCELAVVLDDPQRTTWLVIRPTAPHKMDESDLLLYRVAESGPPEFVERWPAATLWGPQQLPAAEGRMLLLRTSNQDAQSVILRVGLSAASHQIVDEIRAATIVNSNPRATILQDSGDPLFVSGPLAGVLHAYALDGTLQWTIEVAGAVPALLSAADLDRDGRAELLAATPTDQLLHIVSFDDDAVATELRTHPYWSSDPRPAANPLSPLLYDLTGDGTLCVICAGQNTSGHGVVRAFRADGSLLWETILDPNETGGPPTRWHAGNFLDGKRAGVVISSMVRQGDSIQGTYLLDGASGKIVWQKSGYLTDHNISLPYYPMGVPTACDLDGDQVEEIGMDFYCYMAWLRGADGSAYMIRHTSNLGVAGSLYAGKFHNSYIPVFPASGRAAADVDDAKEEPHWFVPIGLHGSTGLMDPDPVDGVWREEFGYDMPRKIGMIDVDGDGRLEVGYAPRSERTFTCRDLASGAIEWRLELPEPTDSPVLSADLDGDGRGEFLIGRYCLTVNAQGQGEILWTAPFDLISTIIADLDGDGVGEIAGFAEGRIQVLKRSPGILPGKKNAKQNNTSYP